MKTRKVVFAVLILVICSVLLIVAYRHYAALHHQVVLASSAHIIAVTLKEYAAEYKTYPTNIEELIKRKNHDPAIFKLPFKATLDYQFKNSNSMVFIIDDKYFRMYVNTNNEKKIVYK